MTIKIIQITTKNGVHFKIGVKGPKHYKTIKKNIINSTKEYVEVLPTLDIKKSEIVSFEYFEETIEEEGE